LKSRCPNLPKVVCLSHSILNECVGMNPTGAGPKATHGAAAAPKISLRRFDVTDQRLLDSIDGADPHCTPEIMVRSLASVHIPFSFHSMCYV
jgi:hypothetical protein